jgi:hypothetical protein
MPASAASVFPEQTTTPPASLGVRWLRDRQQLRRQLDEGRLIKVVHFVRHGEGTHNVEQNYRCGLHGCWEAFCGTGRGYASARFRIGYLYRRINRRAFSGQSRVYCRPKQFYCRPRPAAQLLTVCAGAGRPAPPKRHSSVACQGPC